MIELNKDGTERRATVTRVYIVAGFNSDGNAFAGFNIWDNSLCVSAADIEAYDTFRGWATEELDTSKFVIPQEVPPARENEFRVALMDNGAGTVYPCFVTHGGDCFEREKSPYFLGWLTDTREVDLPKPEPQILVRFRAQVSLEPTGALCDIGGLFITTRSELDQARTESIANLGRILGQDRDIVVPLRAGDFTILTSDQGEVHRLKRFLDSRLPGYTLEGINPLVCLKRESA